MWGIIPAAGAGSRIQPLAFLKELLPVGSQRDGDTERPRAVSEYMIDGSVLGDATKICIFAEPGFPQMYFIENRYAANPTNWWILNRACIEAMLRSSSSEILSHPEQELFICQWRETVEPSGAVYPAMPVP